jgi:hypothetical protein
MKPILLACALLGLLSLDFDDFILDDDPPQTCAECTTDSECEALCHVGPCTHEGQLGCWMPDDFNHPTTRNWWRN